MRLALGNGLAQGIRPGHWETARLLPDQPRRLDRAEHLEQRSGTAYFAVCVRDDGKRGGLRRNLRRTAGRGHAEEAVLLAGAKQRARRGLRFRWVTDFLPGNPRR